MVNPYFAKRRVCALCGLVELSQSLLCYDCRDRLLMLTAAKMKIIKLTKREVKFIEWEVKNYA